MSEPVEIILDASQLEVVEACPFKWFLDQHLNLTTIHTNPALSTGSYYHDVLKFYYSFALEHKKPVSEGIKETIEYAISLATGEAALRWPRVRSEPKFHLDRLRSYFIQHMNEDDQSEILAVEKGFSWLLYEDAERRYILEGIIDLITIEKLSGLTVTDHKTQSRADERYGYNHQALNYMAFTGANYFRYNYIGLQQAQNVNTFRRPVFKPRPGMLDQWKRDVRRTFDEVYRHAAHDLNTSTETHFVAADYPRRRAACSTKYGICQFHKICEEPDDSPWVPTIIKSAYKEKETRWRAWS